MEGALKTFLEEGMWEVGFEECIGVHKVKEKERSRQETNSCENMKA